MNEYNSTTKKVSLLSSAWNGWKKNRFARARGDCYSEHKQLVWRLWTVVLWLWWPLCPAEVSAQKQERANMCCKTNLSLPTYVWKKDHFSNEAQTLNADFEDLWYRWHDFQKHRGTPQIYVVVSRPFPQSSPSRAVGSFTRRTIFCSKISTEEAKKLQRTVSIKYKFRISLYKV